MLRRRAGRGRRLRGRHRPSGRRAAGRAPAGRAVAAAADRRARPARRGTRPPCARTRHCVPARPFAAARRTSPRWRHRRRHRPATPAASPRRPAPAAGAGEAGAALPGWPPADGPRMPAPAEDGASRPLARLAVDRRLRGRARRARWARTESPRATGGGGAAGGAGRRARRRLRATASLGARLSGGAGGGARPRATRTGPAATSSAAGPRAGADAGRGRGRRVRARRSPARTAARGRRAGGGAGGRGRGAYADAVAAPTRPRTRRRPRWPGVAGAGGASAAPGPWPSPGCAVERQAASCAGAASVVRRASPERRARCVRLALDVPRRSTGSPSAGPGSCASPTGSAPWTSSRAGRRRRRRLGCSTPTAAIAARNAVRLRLVQATRWCRRRRRSSRARRRGAKHAASCSPRGDIVLESTPTLIPRRRSAATARARPDPTRVRRQSVGVSRPARAGVARRRVTRPRRIRQRGPLVLATGGPGPLLAGHAHESSGGDGSTRRASRRHCSRDVDRCHGVSVPPQSKMTASSAVSSRHAAQRTRGRASASTGLADRRTSSRSPVRAVLAPRPRPSARPRPTTTMVGTPSSSASANFTPGETPGPVVDEHPHAARARARSASARPPRTPPASLPVATRCTSAGATSRGQHRPELVVGLLGDRRDRAGDADAVRAHRHRDRLAVLVRAPSARAPRRTCGRAGRCGRSRCRGRSPARRRSPGRGRPSRTSAASIVPSAVKSRPATRSTTCRPGSFAPVTQRVPVDHARVDAGSGCLSSLQALRDRCSR